MSEANVWPRVPEFDGAIELFTVYDRPRDYPNHTVVRRWFVVGTGDNDTIPDVVPRVADTLENAREYIPRGFVRTGRRYGEDPFIVETWMPASVAVTLPDN